MAQIIKHRRGLIGGVKNLTARNGELIIASGSISDLSGPFVFIGSPNTVDEGVAGAFNSVSKLYTGTAAPTITAATYGSALDGTPYYASGNKSLYILNNSNVGNTQIDLTGNIEGNTISGVTITNLQSTNVTASFVSASFVGDASGLYNIPATGVTGLNLSKIYSGSVQVTTDSVSGDIHIDADSGVYISGTTLDIKADTTLTGSLFATKIEGTGSLYLQPDQNDSKNIEIYNTGGNDIHLKGNATYSFFGDDVNYLKIDNSLETVSITGVNGVFVSSSLNVTGSVNVNGDTSITGALVVADGSATFDQGLVAQNSDMLLTSGSNLIVQDSGNVTVDYIRGTSQEWNYLALNGNGALNAPDVELGSSGNISLWAEGGTVNVTGSLKVTGDIVFSGSINLGDFTGDTINFNGEVSSSILPSTGSSFDLGSSGQTWNNVWAETAHFNSIVLEGITLDSLALPGDLTVSGTTRFSGSVGISGYTANDVIFVGTDGTLIENTGFTFNPSTGYLSAPIINATNDGNGTNFLVGNDIWIGDINEADAMKFKGADNSNNAKVYLGDFSSNNFLGTTSSDTTLSAHNTLNLKSENGSVYLESYDGSIYLNDDSGNNVRMGGNAYINDNLYVNRIYDDNNNNNYLQLSGWNTDDGNWWESGNGADTTLLNNENDNNLNILQTNNGDVNIDATGGSVNLHSANGFNVTGSLVVSDASGVFNSSLIVSNSDLTLDGGSNIHMDDNAHLYFDTCVDINYDNGTGNLIFANSCNDFEFRNDVSITGSVNVSGDIITDDIVSTVNSDNALHLNGGYWAPDVELESSGQISLFSEGAGSDYAINMTGSVYLADDLNVTGSSTFLGGVTLGNSLYVTGLTQSRIVLAGTGGQLVDDVNFTFDDTTFKIGGGDFEVDLSGNTRTSGSLLVKNGVEITGSLKGQDSSSNWAILGNGFGETYIQSTTGNMILQATTGEVTVKTGNFHVETNARVDGTLQVSGNTSLTGSLTVASGSATMLGGDLYVSGNLQVLGSSTNVNIQSQTVDIGDNIIQVNAYSPFDRYAGLAAYDSGSSGASGSFLWDSTNDYWLIVNANSYSSKVIGTTASTGSTGTEISLTSGTFPIATASNTIGDSLLTYSGTTLAYNTNKFTIDSGTGATAISGNLTLSYSGGTDGGTKTSAVTFRNSSNVLGFVSTTETTNELDGILGYNHSSGVLEFSTLIDGGTY